MPLYRGSRRLVLRRRVVVGGDPVPGTAAAAFLARTSGLTQPQKNNYVNLINGLVTDGFDATTLAPLDALYIVAAPDTTTAALNLVNSSFGLVTHGSLTFAANVGYTGDGSTGYLDTQYAPSTSATNLSINSASIGAYIQSTSASSTSVIMGTATGGGSFLYMVPVQTGSFFWDVNGTSFPSFANTNPQGAWIASRNSSSTTSSLYLNGATTKANAVSDNTGSLSPNNMLLFAVNSNGTPTNFTNYQASAFFIGGALTSTQAFAINNRINTFMSVNSANVY